MRATKEVFNRVMLGSDLLERRRVLEAAVESSGKKAGKKDRLLAESAGVLDAMVTPSEVCDMSTSTCQQRTGGGIVTGARILTSPELYRDIEMHAEYSADSSGSSNHPNASDATVFSVLDCTATAGGSRFLAAVLDHPIDDTMLLSARQRALQRIEPARLPAAPLLARLADAEEDVAWLFRYREDDTLKSLYGMAFFRLWPLRPLNRSAWALTSMNIYRILVSPSIGILAPVVYFVVPYLVIRWKLGLKLSFTAYLRAMYRTMALANRMVGQDGPSAVRYAKYVSYAFSLVFYFQSVFQSLEVSSTLRKICASVSERMAKVRDFFSAADELELLVRTQLREVSSASAVDPFFSVSPSTELEVKEPAEQRSKKTFERALTFGADLRDFRRFDFDAAVARLRRTYALDALLSTVEIQARHGLAWASIRFGGGSQASSSGPPELDMRAVFHPGLLRQRAVSDITKNTWAFGVQGSAPERSALLTGPNAGGKSTLLKAVLLNAVLCQTLTLSCCAAGCALTPFRFISSHVNVPDRQGRESLFEAEMHRAKRNMDVLETLDVTRDRALIVMDEIFSSTNPVEGISGAYAVAKNLGARPNVVSIVSTHYLYLCKLQKDVPGVFANYRLPVVIEKESGAVLRHPYQLKRGISRQYVALELLRANGFGDSILSDAIRVKRQLIG